MYIIRMNKTFFKALGPGILFASTAIGVSHLVQSTRAGADYGFTLVWAILLSNLFKFPFFQYASRYANLTGTSIIDGYKKIGKWMLWLYFIITVATMFFVTSAVGVVTSGFMDNLFGVSSVLKTYGISQPQLVTPAVLFLVCTAILMLGKYKVLDSMIKVIAAVLLTSTLLAFVLALLKSDELPQKAYQFFDWETLKTPTTFAFTIALMGWMPTAMDLSSWNSLWTVERIKQTKYHPSLKETLFDFNFGYIGSAILALLFVSLGAFLMYGSPETLSNNPAIFGDQVVRMYTQNIGSWSYIIIAASAFSIMFGTLIAVLDGYARSLKRIIELITESEFERNRSYNRSILLLSAVSFGIMYFFVFAPTPKGGFKELVDFTTTFSFLVAPIIAIVNFRLMDKKYIGSESSLPVYMKVISYAGIIFLTVFCILRIWQIFS